MTRAALILSALALAGCATTSTPPPIIVKVPVPVSCVSDQLPKAPTYPDTLAALKAAPDQAEFTRLLAAGWPLRTARLEALEAAVEACRKP
jgi:hypothetical protein